MDKRPLLEDLANNAFQTGGAQKASNVDKRGTFRDIISDCLAMFGAGSWSF